MSEPSKSRDVTNQKVGNMGKDNVIGFNGPRNAPTPLDFAEMEQMLIDMLKRVKNEEIYSLALVAVPADFNELDSCIQTDWINLPGIKPSHLIAGVQYLAFDILHQNAETKNGPKPSS
jgi:hypothetical protein